MWLLLAACVSSTDDLDGDGWTVAEDCADDDPAVGPAGTWYPDADGDQFGDRAAPITACRAPDGASTDGTDCDDARADVHPGATEVCNDLDDDCDEAIDDVADPPTWYADADGDSYGDPAAPVAACAPPSGHVADATDCDDLHAEAHPGGVEVCDGLDDDCDTLVDDDDPAVFDLPKWYVDLDEDGYGDNDHYVYACAAPIGLVADATDCDDSRAAVHPGVTEVSNALDDDCNHLTDDSDPNVADPANWYVDGDGDGFGDPVNGATGCVAPAGMVADFGDCDDQRGGIHPGATEVCNDADDDCDLAVDDADPDRDPASTTAWHADADGDGFGAPAVAALACAAPAGTVADDGDCDDGSSAVNPAATEVCNDLDDDCDLAADDADLGLDLASASPWHADGDGDGFGDPLAVQWACAAPPATVADGTDCSDALASVYPGAAEVCDGLDDDCDLAVDDADPDLDPATATAWYADADGDGFGDPAALAATSCAAPDSAVADATDCADGDAAISPAAYDLCEDGIDQDCTGADRLCTLLAGEVDPDTSWTSLVTANQISGFFGYHAAIVDWNGDGADDLAIGTPYADLPIMNQGGVFVYYGPFTGELDWQADADVVITGSRGGAYTGRIHALPDLDGDGDGELTIQSTFEALDAGLFLGGSGSGFADDLRVNAIRSDLSIGIGDPDGDGIPEWAGSYGGLKLYEGTSATVTADFQTTPQSVWTGVDTGDLDGDGIEDLAGGVSFGASSTQSHAGLVFVFEPPYTSRAGLTWTDATATGVDFYQEVGYQVTVGDVDGDGYEDLVAGSQYDDNLYTNAGAFYAWYGPVAPGETTDTADVTIFGSALEDQIGARPLRMRDLDGDGAEEMVVASSIADTPLGETGAVYLFAGPVAGVVVTADAATDGAYLPGSQVGDTFGQWALFADDLTGDGGADLVVTASGNSWDGAAAWSGVVYVFEAL